jgi:hypothetical protein
VDHAELLRILADAQGDPALLALATVDITYPDLPPDDRAALRTALQAAAIPHWFDQAMLAALLGATADSIGEVWEQLTALSVVEPFPARGEATFNVHEATRLALRHHLATTELGRFRRLSDTAAAQFAADARPATQIEWIYHLLCADPEHGADELEDLNQTWSGTTRRDHWAAIIAALGELEVAGLLAGRAQACSQVVIATANSAARPAPHDSQLHLHQPQTTPIHPPTLQKPLHPHRCLATHLTGYPRSRWGPRCRMSEPARQLQSSRPQLCEFSSAIHVETPR